MRLGLLGLVVCGGCGAVSGSPPDAADTDAASVDSPPPCDVAKPFASPVLVEGVTTSSGEGHGWLSADQLTIYFNRNDGTDSNLYFGTRMQPAGAFTGISPLGGVNTIGPEVRPTLTADGLTLFIEAGADIHIATRMNTASIFSMHNPVAVINNTTSTEWNPWISHDGLLMYFVSDRTGNFEIYKTTRANKSSPFGEPMPVGELNTPADEHSPVLSEDGLEIFFGSKRANPGSDIFHATRSTLGAGFGDPTLIVELSGSVSDDFPSWASPDHCQLMFTSNRVDGGGGAYHLWMATRR